MEAVRKMILVPENEMAQRLQVLQAPPEARAEVTTGLQLQELLSNSTIPLDVKVKLVGELIHRQQAFHRQRTQATDLSLPTSSSSTMNTPEATAKTVEQPSNLSNEWISKLIPKTTRSRVRQLLSYLQSQGEPLKWNEQGMLIGQNGLPIKQSSIVDLLRYVTQSRVTKAPPEGFSHFSQQLAAINVPQSLAPQAVKVSDNTVISQTSKRPSRFASKSVNDRPTFRGKRKIDDSASMWESIY